MNAEIAEKSLIIQHLLRKQKFKSKGANEIVRDTRFAMGNGGHRLIPLEWKQLFNNC
jgi:hypothetical protein